MTDETGSNRVAIVGAGLIGTRRARVARAHPSTDVVLVVDVDEGAASRLARELGCRSAMDWNEAVKRPGLDAVVVATPNNLLAPVSLAALGAGKHVLCEKPMATRPGDAEAMAGAAGERGLTLMVGYTLRHHPAVAKAHELLVSGAIGEAMYVRACYGHGGRPGYEKEWRFERDVSGGGELIDQGVHLIDLAGWFLGECNEVMGTVTTSFWDVAPLEDNVFITLRTPDEKVAFLHASCTQWKNCFAFEVFGKKGYLLVEGLGGSYGAERLVLGVRDAENPPPKEELFSFEGEDISWREEWNEFVGAIHSRREPLASGVDGVRVLRVVEAVYNSARTKEVIKLGAVL